MGPETPCTPRIGTAGESQQGTPLTPQTAAGSQIPLMQLTGVLHRAPATLDQISPAWYARDGSAASPRQRGGTSRTPMQVDSISGSLRRPSTEGPSTEWIRSSLRGAGASTFLAWGFLLAAPEEGAALPGLRGSSMGGFAPPSPSLVPGVAKQQPAAVLSTQRPRANTSYSPHRPARVPDSQLQLSLGGSGSGNSTPGFSQVAGSRTQGQGADLTRRQTAIEEEREPSVAAPSQELPALQPRPSGWSQANSDRGRPSTTLGLGSRGFSAPGPLPLGSTKDWELIATQQQQSSKARPAIVAQPMAPVEEGLGPWSALPGERSSVLSGWH
jgi:hypothetical protein